MATTGLTLAEIQRRYQGPFFADLTGMLKPGVWQTPDGCLFIATTWRRTWTGTRRPTG